MTEIDIDKLDFTGLAVLEKIAQSVYHGIGNAFAAAGKDVTSEAFHMHFAAKCAEEGAEALAAYLHASGWARRSEPWHKLDSELADMVIIAFITAYAESRDLIAAISEKVELIFSRGWKDEIEPVSGMPVTEFRKVVDEIIGNAAG